MRLLITGGAGFIGSNLVRCMLRRGHEVLNVDKLTYAGNLNSLADIADDPSYRFAQVDIADAEAVRSTLLDFAPDAVMHLAAESHVDRSIDGPREFIQTNILGTFNLLQASLEHYRRICPPSPKVLAHAPSTGGGHSASALGEGVRGRGLSAGESRGEGGHEEARSETKSTSRLSPLASSRFLFLHVSTDEVYGSLGPDGAFNEETRYDPHSPYSASKASSDHLARAWHDTYGLPVIVTNCSNNYGPYQFPEKLIPVVILKCLRGEPIPVYGRGENIRDWLYVEDHCDALATVLERGTPGETYNIGGNNELRNIDLVRTLCSILDELRPLPSSPSPKPLAPTPSNGDNANASALGEGVRRRGPSRSDRPSYADHITFVADRPGHDLRYAIDATKIKRELGWQPKQDHQSGFRKTVAWYLENEDWWQNILSGDYRLERLGTAK